MKVLLDTTALYTDRAGVARYTRGLLRGLREAGLDDGVGELVWPVENFDYAQPARALKTAWRELVWAKTVAPRRARGADVLHHLSLPLVPFAGARRHVATLHDVALLRDPERFRPWLRWSGRRRLERVGRADRIVAVSRFSADEAMRLLGLRARKIEVIPEAGWFEDELAAPAAAPPGLPAEYFLFVGSLEPGKNLALLREIYLADPRGLPPLVVAGARWSGVAREGPPPPDWHFLGAVPREQLPVLYRGARALLFPSRYEGFGLPVLEAMGAGCPVVCAPVASLPEVAGEAAVFAALNATEFGGAMRRIARDEAWAAEWRARGLARAAEFSWQRTAVETHRVWRELTSA
jgi:alpha-1,3-rhamnosyl/mannosyltransferase